VQGGGAQPRMLRLTTKRVRSRAREQQQPVQERGGERLWLADTCKRGRAGAATCVRTRQPWFLPSTIQWGG